MEQKKKDIENKEVIKVFEQEFEDNKYKLKVNIEKNKESIKFELALISNVSHNIFKKIYKYENIIEDFNLSKNKYQNIIKLYEEIKEFQIIYKEDNFIIIKINNIYPIILTKIKIDSAIKKSVKNNKKNKRIIYKSLNFNLKKDNILKKSSKVISEKKYEPVNLRNSINSTYINKKIFSYVNINRKLNLFHYNKSYQKILNISIEEYKVSSKKYLIIEKNGTGKEYELNTNKLIFEGEYKNRKKMEKVKNI